MLALNYFSLSLFLGGLVALGSGSMVFFAKDTSSRAVRMPWMLLNLSTAVWSFGYYYMITAPTHESAILSDWILHLGAICIPIFYLRFILALTDTYRTHRPVFISSVVAGCLFIIASGSSLFLTDTFPKYIFNFAPNAGPLYAYFTSYFFVYTIFAGIVLFRTSLHVESTQAIRLRFVFWSSLAGFIGGGSVFFLTFNIPIPPYPIVLFAFYPLIITYAILRHQLFTTKVVATEILTFALWISLLFRTILASELQDQAFDLILFIISLVLGIFLIRSVVREVEQREFIERQEKELEKANKQQEVLLHFISHEIKGYLTKGEAAFAEIAEEGTQVPMSIHTLASGALEEMRKGVATVMNILDASNLKRGTVTYKKEPMNFRTIVETVVEAQRAAAYEKHLGFDVDIADGQYDMLGDAEKLREHVIDNLIDNAIKYTPSGTVRVRLSDGNKKIRFTVQDSGVGITPEDMAVLFTEGGHGKDSIKVNVHSTGYGLFIAKEVVDAHGGRIWAESQGEGKGSSFMVELTLT